MTESTHTIAAEMPVLYELRHDTPIGELVITYATSLTDSGGTCVGGFYPVVIAVAFAEREGWMRERVRQRFALSPLRAVHRCGETLQHDLGLPAAIKRYFDGDLGALDDVATHPGGTVFQRRVYRALSKVPPGQTRSYGQLAAQLGTSARAVGNANARNPVSLFVPCHRVVGADGSLTGYAFGIDRKRWLIEHEAAHAPRAAQAPIASNPSASKRGKISVSSVA